MLELFTVEAIVARGLLLGSSAEDQANLLHDLRQQLRELSLAGGLRPEEHQPYLLAAMSLGPRFQLDLYTALTIAAAGVSGRPLIVDDEQLYGRLRRAAAAHRGLRVERLSDYP